MIERRVLELMNLAIDGVATPSQRTELESYLAIHPEFRSYLEALSQLSQRLDAAPMVEPPESLEPRIMEAINELPALAPAHTERFPAWLKSFLAPKLRPWSTFGLGLAAGIFIFAAIQYGRPDLWDVARDIDTSNMSGSIVRERAPETEPVALIPIEATEGAASGSLTARDDGENVRVDIVLQSTVAVEWLLSFDPAVLTLLRVERQGIATHAFAANRSSVRGLHTGDGGATLVFSGPAEAANTLELKLLRNGEPVFEGAVAPSAKR
jgi:hypothetical protein